MVIKKILLRDHFFRYTKNLYKVLENRLVLWYVADYGITFQSTAMFISNADELSIPLDERILKPTKW